MSKILKTIIWIVVIIVIIGGIWFWYKNMKGKNAENGSASQNTNSAANSGLSQGTSDASLNQDLSAIDNQLNGLASDSASADQSLNGQFGQ